MSKQRVRTNNRLCYEGVTERVRIYKRNNTFYVNYQFNGKQIRRSLKTSSKKQARLSALKIDAELETGTHKTPKKNTVKLTEAIDAYRTNLEVEGRAAKTFAKYQTVFDRMRHLADSRGVILLSRVDLSFVDAYRSQRTKAGAKAKTIHTEVTIIRQVVNFALSRGFIDDDPLLGMKLKRPKPTEQPCWRAEEIEQILAECNDHYRPIMTVLANTGMRIGEAKHLTWDDIDFDNGFIHIRAKGDWKPKTGDRRSIPMHKDVQPMLAELPRTGVWVFTAQPTAKYPSLGRQISERRLLEHLKRVLNRLGLTGKTHTFRHSFISNALINGAAEAMVRKWVGHVDPEVMKLYTHIADVDSKAAMQRLSKSQ